MHPYNISFTRDTNKIFVCPPVDRCVYCCVCHSVWCLMCPYKNDNKVFCATCYLPAYCDKKNMNRINENESVKTRDEVTNYLISVGMNISSNDATIENKEIYEAIHKQNSSLYNANIGQKVIFPVETTEYLQIIVPIKSFVFFDVGTMLFKDEYTTKEICLLMELMIQLVNLDCNNDESNTQNTYHSIIPNMIPKVCR